MVADKLGVLDAADRNSLGKKMEGVALKVNTKLGGDNMKVVGNVLTWLPGLKP